MTGAFLRTLFAFQRLRGRRLGIRDGQTGSVTFVQRFGGALQLFPHLHVLVPDGLFVPGREPGAPLTFAPLPPPDDDDIRRLVVRVATRLHDLATRRIEQAQDQPEWQWPEGDDALRYGAAIEALRMPRQAGTLRRHDRTRDEDVHDGEDHKPLCDSADGFSLDAARVVRADDRDRLEALLRCGLRAPFSNERLSLDPDGSVRLRLLRPRAHGRSDVVLGQAAFLPRPHSSGEPPFLYPGPS